MKKLKRNTDGIHNRGTLIGSNSVEGHQPVTDPPFYMPTDGEVKRAIRLRSTANVLRNSANDIKGQDFYKSGLLERRARIMEMRAVLILLGEGKGDDD